MNRGSGKFEEIGALSGVAYSELGRTRSGMGVDAADVNQDGWIDLFVKRTRNGLIVRPSRLHR